MCIRDSPDEICKKYGADTLRMYEMFLGPLEQAKPWNTSGITGVHSFLKKLWRLFHPNGKFSVNENDPAKDSLKTFNHAIRKVTNDINNYSFNTCISSFMICVNELSSQKCNNRKILEPLIVLISPFAPHICEELWEKLGNTPSISNEPYPIANSIHLKEMQITYPISFNGKMRFTLDLEAEASIEEIEQAALTDERTAQYLEGKTIRKVIVVPSKIVNIVCG